MNTFTAPRKVLLISLLVVLAIASVAKAQWGHFETDAETKALSDRFYHTMLGELALQQRDWELALYHYEKAAYLSDDQAILRIAVVLAMRLGNDRKAAALGQRWIKTFPDSVAPSQALVPVYIRMGHNGEAIKQVERIIRLSDNLYQRTHSAGLAHIANENAIALLTGLLNQYPKHADLLILLAFLSNDLQRYENALGFASRAIEIAPKSAKAHAALSDALIGLGRIEEGLAALRDLATSYPDDDRIILKAGRNHFLYGRNVQASEYYKWFYDRNTKPASTGQKTLQQTDYLEALYALSVSYLNLKRLKEARPLLISYRELAEELDEETERLRAAFYLGRLEEEEGFYKKALAYYKEVNAGIFDIEAQVGVARVYSKMERDDLVEEAFEAARSKASNDQERIALFIAQARVAKETRSSDDAFDVYKRALDTYGNESELLYSRATLASDLKQYDLAERDLKHIIEEDPGNWQALNALGYILADANIKLTEAKAYILKAHGMQPNNSAILDSVGWVEYRLNNLDKAETYIKRAANLQAHPEILGHLAEVFWSQNKQDQARALIKKALYIFPDDAYLQELHEHKMQ